MSVFTAERLKVNFARLCGLAALFGCRTSVSPTPDQHACNPFANIAPEGTTAMLPHSTPPVLARTTTIIGYVADSASNRGVRGAFVLLIATETTARDSSWTVTDSTGGFQISGLRPGHYRLSVRSANFHMLRDSLELSEGVDDTLRILMSRGLPLCNVRLE
jgi:hypothetical protein